MAIQIWERYKQSRAHHWPPEVGVKIIIRVEITTDWDETDTFEICQLEGPYRQLEQEKIRLLLDEGKDVLYTFQRTVVAARAAGNSYAIRIPNRHLSLF